MFEDNINEVIIYKYNDIGKIKEVHNESKIYKNNKGVGFYNIPCSFDIETTSTYYNNDKIAFMYIWQFCLNGAVFIGRTWTEFLMFYNYVCLFFDTSEKQNLIIYVHNLAFEFQFMRKWLEWKNIFAIKNRTPLKAETVDGIIFKCSYLLTNKSLKKVGEDLQKYKFEKMVGDLDYKKIRHSKTPLTDEEILYCVNDVKIVVAHIQEQIEKEKYIFNIPLTQTGYVRREVRKNCLTDKKKKKFRNLGYKQLMKNLQLQDIKEYKLLKQAFSGGFTHANAFNTNAIKENVIAYDFCSSYPTMMLAYDFPMSRGQYIKIESKEDFREKLKYYCCVFTVKLVGVQAKNNLLHENYISFSKCYTVKNYTLNNGRIVNADEIIMTLTEVDFWIIEQCYTYAEIYLSDFIIYEKGRLPKEIILSVLDFYNKKTKLKGVGGEEIEYLRSKQMLNSIYGMCVTDIIRAEIEYNYTDNSWCDEIQKKFSLQEQEEQLQKENESQKRFLFYPWGIYVTAYARRALWSGILEFKDDYIYSDTDSIYVYNNGKHDKYIEKYNDYIKKCCLYTLNLYNIDPALYEPSTVEGIKKPLGVWEIDKKLKRFKTLGAKRYIYENIKNDVNITVSGLNKKVTVPYLQEKYGDKIFEEFKDGLHIPRGYTGKMTHTYIDDEIKAKITDFNGVESVIYEKSFIHLEDSDYSLSMSADYKKFLLTFWE